jgi:hypothetical protein
MAPAHPPLAAPEVHHGKMNHRPTHGYRSPSTNDYDELVKGIFSKFLCTYNILITIPVLSCFIDS